ncbi:MAG TPA: UPF0182 family protein [Nocardioides sp.]|nr:UPF0182 family protein [Nocardioides sp.]
MSDSLEEEFDEFRPRRSRRARVLLFSVLGVIVAFFLVTLFASIYTDRLWYGSVGYSGVYDKMLWTRVGLFFGFGLLMAGSVAANMVVAYRARPFSRPDSPEQTGLDRYRDAVAPIRILLLVSVSAVIGLFGGVAANGKWRSFLLWANREPFHVTDPYFHKDVGFYVFSLPWLHFVVGYVIAVLVLSAITAIVVHYLYGGIRLQAASDRMSSTATIQLSVLGGLALLAKAVGYYLDRFDLVTGSSPVVTGMSYTDQHSVLPARNILIGVALICALLFFVTAWRRVWLLPAVGISLLVVTSILLGLIWPAFVQNFQVNPNKPDKEAPYIAANIAATRAAYDLNSIKLTRQKAAPATPESVQNLIDQTTSVPVVDPGQISQAFSQTQAVYGYYTVPDVLDVDHYMIDGNDRAVVIGARELDQTGINASDQNWSNLHTRYTHGSGVIAAFANQRPADDSAESQQIQWAEGQDVGQDSLQRATGPYQDQIYFGEAGQGSPGYSIVGKAPGAPNTEIDLTSNGTSSYTTYEGGGGVGVGGFFHKLMYAIKFGDANFLLSSRVGPESKVIYYRDPAERVEKVAPWLNLDGDVYPVVEDGHILWVVDGYTTTDQYPQSERDSFSDMTSDVVGRPPGVRTLPTDQINYMRNAVKATVDAYTGEVKLYAWDESDPILQAWESAFPGTVLNRDQIPSALLPHLRYPEDMFKVQRFQYARYHVKDPGTFFGANSQWQVSPDAVRKDENQAPIRMFIPDPVTGDQTWSLTSSYVPNNKSNLAGFVTADSDPTTAGYGTVTVEQPRNENVPGPAQAYGQLINDPRITRKTQSFRLGDASPSYGNVVGVPLAGGLMYVVPVYATREGGSTSSYRTLRYVMVSFGQKTGIGDTLVDAIEDMIGTTAPPPPDQGNPGSHTGNGQGNDQQKGDMGKAHALLKRAQRDFAAADQAFKDGKFGRYVHLNHQARAEVARALNLLK